MKPRTKAARIMVWRFAEAPKELRLLHGGSPSPEWLVLVPRVMSSPELDDLILRQRAPGDISRYETSTGDVVYVGKLLIPEVPECQQEPTGMDARPMFK